MGVWGTSLYANDTACDIRGDYEDKLKRGKSNEETTQELIEANKDIIADSEEAPLFWFALADTQWNYGRLLPFVKENAIAFLSNHQEMERWKDSSPKQAKAWERTLLDLQTKLNSPQPSEKKVSKYRLYQCKWKLGDVFAYRFSHQYSQDIGFAGKYIAFRKVSEDIWWPGHIVPVVRIYNWMGESIPGLECFTRMQLLSQSPSDKGLQKASQNNAYWLKLLSTSERVIPKDNLFYIGNIQGDDLVPFRGSDYWTGYWPVGWDGSKSNTQFEQHVIELYLSWNKIAINETEK